MDKVVQTCWDGYEQKQLVITGEAALVPTLLADNQSMPQGWMEGVCRVVIAMGDPMSHELSLQMLHFLRSYTGWVRVVFTQFKVTITSVSGWSL